MLKNKAIKGPILAHRNFTHTILDLCVPHIKQIHLKHVKEIVKEASEISKLNVISIKSHSFGPNAFTIFALLAESHISVHTWPEYEYIACDVFSCSGNLQKSINHLIKNLKPKAISKFVHARSSPNMNDAKSQLIGDTGPGIWTLLDVRKIKVVQSKYQNIQVLSHKEYGRMLAINNDIQFTEKDYFIYNTALLSPIKKMNSHKDVLIIGGGDGLCCTYLLENQLAENINVLELDPMVIDVCKRYFPKLSKGLDSKQVSITFGDATKTICKIQDESYDVVILDTTAPDTKFGNSTYSMNFFKELERVLKPKGRLCANGTSIWFKYYMTSEMIQDNISRIFDNVSSNTVWIPSFGSPWIFFSASKR